MSIILGANGEPLRKELRANYRPGGPNNPNKGWIDSSPRTGRSASGVITEDQYYASLNLNEALVKYILVNYEKESQVPILVLGYSSLPIAIELSQWTYPIYYASFSLEETAKVKRDCERYAGVFKKLIQKDSRWSRNYPITRVTIFTGLIGWDRDDEAVSWVKDILESTVEIVCALPSNRNWYNLFSEYFTVIPVKEKQKWIVLRISRK
jgi:hypothetical protein